MERETIQAAQIRFAQKARSVGPPDCYRYQAVWLKLEAKRGYPSSADSIRYARNLLRLARDIESRPEHYYHDHRRVTWVRLPDVTLKVMKQTDWQWSGLISC